MFAIIVIFQVTQLKIDNNPFAKGFRDAGAGKREKKRFVNRTECNTMSTGISKSFISLNDDPAISESPSARAGSSMDSDRSDDDDSPPLPKRSRSNQSTTDEISLQNHKNHITLNQNIQQHLKLLQNHQLLSKEMMTNFQLFPSGCIGGGGGGGGSGSGGTQPPPPPPPHPPPPPFTPFFPNYRGFHPAAEFFLPATPPFSRDFFMHQAATAAQFPPYLLRPFLSSGPTPTFCSSHSINPQITSTISVTVPSQSLPSTAPTALVMPSATNGGGASPPSAPKTGKLSIAPRKGGFDVSDLLA